MYNVYMYRYIIYIQYTYIYIHKHRENPIYAGFLPLGGMEESPLRPPAKNLVISSQL